jgi:hypothetical protein
MARSKSKHRRVQNQIRQKWKRQADRKKAAKKEAAEKK